jgi:type II secretion system protein L
MTTRLFIRLTRFAIEAGHDCEWILRDVRGTLIRSGRDPLGALPPADHTIGILAADVLLIRTVTLPPGPRARTQAAMAHALEPFMLSDPAANHVVTLGTAEDGSTVLAAVARHWFDACLAGLTQAGHYPERIIAESSLIDGKPGTWVVIHDTGGGFVVTDDRRIAALDSVTGSGVPAGLRLLAKTAIEAKQQPQRVQVYHAESAPVDAIAWRDNIGLPVENVGTWDWRLRTDPTTGFVLDAQPNVLTGLPGNRPGMARHFQSWRMAALLGALIVVVHTGATMVHWFLRSSERSALQTDMRTVFRKSVSATDPLVDPVIQTHRALSLARRAVGAYGDEDFMLLLGRLSAESAGAALGRLQMLQYAAGTLTAEFRGAQAAAIEQVAAKLRAQGYRAAATVTSPPTIERLVIGVEP